MRKTRITHTVLSVPHFLLTKNLFVYIFWPQVYNIFLKDFDMNSLLFKLHVMKQSMSQAKPL